MVALSPADHAALLLLRGEAEQFARKDPLEGGAINGAAYVDAILGNPPFMDGNQVWVPVEFFDKAFGVVALAYANTNTVTVDTSGMRRAA